MGIDKDKSKPASDKELSSYRRIRKQKLTQLSDYQAAYNVDKFIVDLKRYFDDEVEFNLEKIHQTISKDEKLAELIRRANKNSTHPVVEFVQDIFKDIGQSGDQKWSGTL